MSNYTKTTDFESKDALSSGDPNKIVKGQEIDDEFDAIATMSATKADKEVPTAANNVALLDGTGNLADGGKGIPSGAIVGTTDTQTLTNKTISSASNTLTIDADVATVTNIKNADIKSGAAIDAAKIHDGSVSNTEFGYLNGVTSAIQTQFTNVNNGTSIGTGVITATHLATGSVAADEIAANAVTESKIYWENSTASSQAIAGSGTWVPAAGLYTVVVSDIDDVDLEVYVSGAWRNTTGATWINNGTVYSDGSNVRFRNISSSSRTIYYVKLA